MVIHLVEGGRGTLMGQGQEMAMDLLWPVKLHSREAAPTFTIARVKRQGYEEHSPGAKVTSLEVVSNTGQGPTHTRTQQQGFLCTLCPAQQQFPQISSANSHP